MRRFCLILALLACFVQGCQPRTIVYVSPVQIAHTPDLNGAVQLKCDAGKATAAVVAYRDGWYYAATAKHVTDASTWIRVDGTLVEKFAASRRRDVALIRWKSSRTYSIYPLARAELGQECWVVGWPWPGKIVNRGWVSRIRGSSLWHNAGGAHGCSGGPILSAKGKLLGIVTSYLVEIDDGWPIPSRNVYNSMGRAVAASEIEWLINTIPDPK